MNDLNRYDLQRLRRAIRPFRLHFFPRVGSTNDHAARMRGQRRLYAPALVVSGMQTRGRGRGSNAWWSNAGSITATLALPIDERLSAHQIPLIAGVALRKALAAFLDAEVRDRLQLKWPNDVIFHGRKLAGILCERVGGIDLVGLGINVNVRPAVAPAKLRTVIGSLSQIAGRARDKTDVLLAVTLALHQSISRRDEYPFPAVLREYQRHHALTGRRVRILRGLDGTDPLSGTCVGLDRLGRLLVQHHGRQVPVIAGHVQSV